jgi:molecular chaperone DnaK (HSP70)
MVVDCGGGTVDLTTRQLLKDERLSEITERTGDYCGGSYVDKEFIKFLERKVGSSAIKLVEEKQYGQLQYVVQEFCRLAKIRFTGNRSDFQTVDLELDGNIIYLILNYFLNI